MASPHNFVSFVPAQTLHRQPESRTQELLTEEALLRCIQSRLDYMRTDCRKPVSFAVALNSDIGASSLNAEVKVFVRVQNVSGSNSG